MKTIAIASAILLLLSSQASLHIVVIEGEGAVNIIQQKTAVAPIVEVRDQNNVPVAGAVVRFTIAGGKQAAFAGGSQTLTVTTNAAGRAAASAVNPLARGAVQIQVQATFQGQTAAATIAQTNLMTAAQAGQAAAGASGGGGGGLGGGAIAGIAGGAAAAAGAVIVTSKSNDADQADTGSSPPSIDPAARAAAGTFVLQTINGSGLPAVAITSPPAACPVVFDNATLTLTADRELLYDVTEVSHNECRIGPSESFRSTHSGAWTLTGSTIRFQSSDRSMLLDDATLSANTLTMTFLPPHLQAGAGDPPRVNSSWRK